MKVTKKQLRGLIKESFGVWPGGAAVLKPMSTMKSRAQYIYDFLDRMNEDPVVEMTPGAEGQAAMGGLTPADQGIAAAKRDAYEAQGGGGVDAGPGPAYRFVEEALPELRELRERAHRVGFYDVRDALDQAIAATEEFN